MGETHHTFCRICESLCGLEVETEGNKIIDVRPDNQHIATSGFSCVKGLKQHEMYDSPDRLLYPLAKRADGQGHERVSWDRALDDIGQKVRRIIREDGPDAVAMYVGTAAGFGVLHPAFAQGFMDGVGSKSFFASATQDCSNKFATARHMYGFPFTQPFPDVVRNQCLIIVGGNPVISKWSFLQVPNPGKHIKAIKEKGGRVIVVDPRFTETARIAEEHTFIRPGTDIFFFLSFLQQLEEQDGIRWEKVKAYMAGAEEVLDLAREWTPEKTSEVTGIAPETLKELVAVYINSDGAALYSSTGVNMGGQGALSFWIQEVINALSGNLDRKGGTLVGRGIMDFIKFGVKNNLLVRDHRSRVGDFGTVNDAFPGGILADEILTPGKGQIKALFVTGGNPLITMADAAKLKKAFQSLELLVCLDILPNETCSVATHVLPCTDPFQRPDLPFVFPLMLGLQARPYLQATKAILPPKGEQRDEASIYVDLAKACGISLWGSKTGQLFFETLMRFKRSPNGNKTLPQETLLNMILLLTRQPSFGKLLKNPHGKARPDHKEDDFLGKRVVTKDGKVNLAPDVLMEGASVIPELFKKERSGDSHFRLITRRAVTTHNSWTHNHERMIKGTDGTNYLYMNSADASEAGISAGDMADVESKHGKVRLPVKFLDELMRGTVALPHGWGHQHAKNLSVASRTRGVNVNILAGSGTENIDRLSGMSKLTALEVTVKPAEGEQHPTWSGLPEQENEKILASQAETG